MKTLLTISLLTLSAIPVFAKKKTASHVPPAFTIRVGLGYALPVAGAEAMVAQSHLQPISGSQTYDGTYTTYDLKRASLSAGFGAVLAPCLMLNEHIGVEVGVGFGIAMKKYSLNFTSTDPNNSGTDNFTSYAKMPVIVMPALVVSTGTNNVLSGYARAGLALPVAGKIITEEKVRDDQNNTLTTTFEIKNRFSIGLCGAAGARYKLNNHMALYFELNGMAISLRPKTGEYTSFIQNGQQVLQLINVSDTHFEYEYSYAEKSNNSTSQPTKATAFSTPFNNLGISFGLTIGL